MSYPRGTGTKGNQTLSTRRKANGRFRLTAGFRRHGTSHGAKDLQPNDPTRIPHDRAAVTGDLLNGPTLADREARTSFAGIPRSAVKIRARSRRKGSNTTHASRVFRSVK